MRGCLSRSRSLARKRSTCLLSVVARHLAEFLGPGSVAGSALEQFEAAGYFRDALVVTAPDAEVKQLLVAIEVAGDALQKLLDQFNGLVGHAIAGEEVDVVYGGVDKSLGLLVHLRLGRQFLQGSHLDFGRRRRRLHLAQLGPGGCQLAGELRVLRFQADQLVVEFLGPGVVFFLHGQAGLLAQRLHQRRLVLRLPPYLGDQIQHLLRFGQMSRHLAQHVQQVEGVVVHRRLEHSLQQADRLVFVLLTGGMHGHLQKAAEFVVVGGKDLFRHLFGRLRVAGADARADEHLQSFCVVLDVGNLLQRRQRLGCLPGFLHLARLRHEHSGVIGRQRHRLVHPALALVRLSLGAEVIGEATVDLRRLRALPVALVELGQPGLNLDVVRIKIQDLLQHFHGLGCLVGFQVGLGQLHVLRAGVRQHPLHGVEVGQPLHGVAVPGIELGDLLVHRDPAHQETFAGVLIGQPGVVVQGFGDLLLADVEVAEVVEDVLILGVLAEDLLVGLDGVLELALRGQLLRLADCFTLVEVHRKLPTPRGQNLTRRTLTRALAGCQRLWG